MNIAHFEVSRVGFAQSDVATGQSRPWAAVLTPGIENQCLLFGRSSAEVMRQSAAALKLPKTFIDAGAEGIMQWIIQSFITIYSSLSLSSK